MQDLTIDQIIQIGQMYFPQMDAEQIIDVFEKFKKILPNKSNLEIAQVIKMAVDENKGKGGNLKQLRQLLGNRDIIK